MSIKTYLLNSENQDQQILGFLLTSGLNFKKVDLVTNDKSNSVFFVETTNSQDEKNINSFVKENDLQKPKTILSNNKVTNGLKVIGTFKKLGDKAKRDIYFLDKSTNNKFVIE
jgi:hypothetical protein